MKVLNGRTGEDYVLLNGAWQVYEWEYVQLSYTSEIGNARLVRGEQTSELRRSDDGSWFFQPWAQGEYEVRWNSDSEQGFLRLHANATMLGQRVEPSGPQLITILQREVCELAIDLHSLVNGRCWVRIESGKGGSLGAKVNQVDNKDQKSFIEWVAELQLAWTLIERTPCSDLRFGPVIVRPERARTSAAKLKGSVSPDRRFVHDVAKTKTFDTIEHRWLKDTLRVAIEQARSEIKLLPTNSLIDDLYPHGSGEAATKNMRGAEVALNQLESLGVSKLCQCTGEVRERPRPSKRLMTRHGYVQAFQLLTMDATSIAHVQELSRLSDLYRQEAIGGIKKSSEIYELWCFLRLYYELRRLGFESVGAESVEPQQCLTLSERGLGLRKQEYLLSRKVAAGDICITLAYDMPDQNCNLRPDILFTIDAPRRALGLRKLRVAMDAKYHDFDNLGGKGAPSSKLHSLRHDIENVALGKYLEKLHADVSFILHPCKGYDWRGEKPYEEFIGDGADDIPVYEELAHPGHRIGSLLFRPGHREDVLKLLTLVFHYHLGLTSLCLHCGRELSRSENFRKNTDAAGISDTIRVSDGKYDWNPAEPRTAFQAVCDCGHNWRVSFCSHEVPQHGKFPGTDNRIITPGRQTDPGKSDFIGIHQYVDSRARCPRCGQCAPGKPASVVGEADPFDST